MDLTPEERFLRTCRGEPVDRPPVWLMRQAGRYLPEYRAVRAGVSFLEMCRDVDRAVEVSLQPIDLVGSEAVIMFQDIFTPIPAMGVDLDFAPGPVMAKPIRDYASVAALATPDVREAVPFVFEIIHRLRKSLEDRKIPLLGFAGAPFTLAAYMVEGQGSKHFGVLKRMIHQEPDVLRLLLDKLTDLTVDYLGAQLAEGAQAVQLFDTWAGLLSPEEYANWAHRYHCEIAERLDRRFGPLILYVNDGAHVIDQSVHAGFDVVSLDWRVDLERVARVHGEKVSIQGNLDPCALAAPPERIAEFVRELHAKGESARGHVMNLGHGCLPETPVEGVRAFTAAVRALPTRSF